ncbi:hypothetical protein QTP88_008662 [Uroleucon formosanum]
MLSCSSKILCDVMMEFMLQMNRRRKVTADCCANDERWSRYGSRRSGRGSAAIITGFLDQR